MTQYDSWIRIHGEMNFILTFGKTTAVNGYTLPVAVCSNVSHLKDVDIILVAANDEIISLVEVSIYKIDYIISRKYSFCEVYNIMELLILNILE